LKAGGARAVCEVRDQGGGIAPEAMERLFQPQRSTKEGGSGLGLAITRQLALALGGSVALASAGPGGCVFRLELPLATLAEDGSESRQESVVEQHG
jgi:signal transduction histidine kinase